MNVGMLWQDNSTDALAVKVQRAAAYYRAKYGREPNLCFTRVLQEPITVGAVRVRESRQVQANHLWMGVDADPVGI